jgi:hypothetical protein
MITIDGETAIDSLSFVGEVGVIENVLESSEPLYVVTTGLDESACFTIHNMRGALMLTTYVEGNQSSAKVDVSSLAAGTYIYSIKTSKQKFFGKIMIK